MARTQPRGRSWPYSPRRRPFEHARPSHPWGADSAPPTFLRRPRATIPRTRGTGTRSAANRPPVPKDHSVRRTRTEDLGSLRVSIEDLTVSCAAPVCCPRPTVTEPRPPAAPHDPLGREQRHQRQERPHARERALGDHAERPDPGRVEVGQLRRVAGMLDEHAAGRLGERTQDVGTGPRVGQLVAEPQPHVIVRSSGRRRPRRAAILPRIESSASNQIGGPHAPRACTETPNR